MEIMINALNKNYNKLVAIDNLSLYLKPGIYGLLGHNGAGKSTLLKILATILPFHHGTITFDGLELKNNEKQYRKHLGYMPQQQQLPSSFSVEGFLYYIAAYKNIKQKEANVIINHILETVNLNEKKRARLDSLSGGMKQRLMIAQSLLNDPDILLLDEPTAGLDPVERRNFREMIASTSENRIVLIATHMISDVEYIANKIILMKKGKILTSATQEELLASTHVYESYLPFELLQKEDKTIKLVNIMRDEKGKRVRFISKQNACQQVSTVLDDVYLDWLD